MSYAARIEVVPDNHSGIVDSRGRCAQGPGDDNFLKLDIDRKQLRRANKGEGEHQAYVNRGTSKSLSRVAYHFMPPTNPSANPSWAYISLPDNLMETPGWAISSAI